MREVQVGLGNSQGGVEVEDMLCTLGGGEVKGRSGPMSWSATCIRTNDLDWKIGQDR